MTKKPDLLKTYALWGDEVILYPRTAYERNLTREKRECEVCTLHHIFCDKKRAHNCQTWTIDDTIWKEQQLTLYRVK